MHPTLLHCFQLAIGGCLLQTYTHLWLKTSYWNQTRAVKHEALYFICSQKVHNYSSKWRGNQVLSAGVIAQSKRMLIIPFKKQARPYLPWEHFSKSESGVRRFFTLIITFWILAFHHLFPTVKENSQSSTCSMMSEEVLIMRFDALQSEGWLHKHAGNTFSASLTGTSKRRLTYHQGWMHCRKLVLKHILLITCQCPALTETKYYFKIGVSLKRRGFISSPVTLTGMNIFHLTIRSNIIISPVNDMFKITMN